MVERSLVYTAIFKQAKLFFIFHVPADVTCFHSGLAQIL